MNKKVVYKICVSGLLIALGYILPFLSGNIPSIGKMLLPMHIPVLIAGFVLGPIYGLLLGILIPLTRSLLFGIPILYPNALIMMFELASYGLISGLLFNKLKKKNNILLSIIISLVVSLIGGRIIYGIVKYFLYLVMGINFTIEIYLTDILYNSWIGIIFQMILIPILVLTLYKLKIIK